MFGATLQMERRMGRIADPLRFAVARQILQRGLSTNPDSGCLAQVGPHQAVSVEGRVRIALALRPMLL